MSKEKVINLSSVLLVSVFVILKAIVYGNNLAGREVFLMYDEAIYAMLSQRILSGDLFSAFHPYWNSGFSVATIPFYLATYSWETAQVLVSMTSHIVLIFVMYFTLRKTSNLLALTAAFLTAFSPSFSKLVLSWGVTEPLYILFLWLGIYFGWQALKTFEHRYYAFTGIFFGLAYFTRTESIYMFGTFCVVAFLSLVLKKRKNLRIFNKISIISTLGAIAAYFYFPITRLAKFTTFGFLIFKSTKGSLLAMPFLFAALLAIPFRMKKLSLSIIFRSIIPKFGIMLALFLLVNLPYVTIISMNLGKPTLSGKYAYIGSAHPFTPEKNRITTWAQDIWSIDFPNYRSSYYDSAKTLPLMWKNIENSIEAFLKRTKTNLDFYANDNIFTNSEIKLILFGFLVAILQKKFRIFALYLAILWLGGFIFITYFMDAAIRYLAFAFPLFYIAYAFAVLGIGQILAKVNKQLLPLTLIFFALLFFNKNFDTKSLRHIQSTGGGYDQKEIGDWLKSQKIDLIMARTEGIAFYANAKMIYVPAANPQTIIQFAKAWGIEYLVARPVESSWDYMRPIVNPKFVHKDVELIHSFSDGTLIWKIKLAEEEKIHNFRTTEDVNKKFEDININSQTII